jgi:tRNA(Ile)-lysidine synthase
MKKTTDTLIHTLEGFLSKRGIGPTPTLYVGYSGGGDSSALAAALARVRAESRGAPPKLIYIDHGIRAAREREEERAHAMKFAQALGLELFVEGIKPGKIEALAKERAIGVEGAARDMRYAIFNAYLDKTPGAWLFLAHNADDQAETILMRALSGSGPRGLRGIGTRRGRILRPFLGLSHAELLGFLDREGLPYFTDSTNLEDEYRRNQVRHRLIPEIQYIYPGYKNALATLSRKMRLIDAHFEAASRGAWEARDGRLYLKRELFLSADPAERLYVLEAGARELSPGSNLSLRFSEQIIERQSLPAHGLVASGCGFRLFAEEAFLILENRLALPGKKGYFFILASESPLELPDNANMRIYWGRDPQGGPARGSFSFPLALRSSREEDAIRIKGGTKRVWELLRERSVPEACLPAVPVLEDKDGIVCIYGKAMGFPNRFAERGRALTKEDVDFLSLEMTERGLG